jgi:diguanylate cyclase (GGDEF)-like protein/PAS domain S-box-containing protein
MVTFNRRFGEMWEIPEAVLEARDDDTAVQVAVEKVKNPEVFLAKVKELYAHPEMESFDTIELNDGRVFERYSQPHRIGEEVLGRVWSFKDVTEQTHTEAELRSSERRYRGLFEDSRQAIYLTTKAGEFIDANPAAVKMFGYDEGDLIGMNARDLYLDPRDRAAFQKAIEDRGSVVDYPVTLLGKSGKEMECLLSSTVWIDGSGEVQGYQGIIENVTARNRAERALRENEQKFRSLIERASDTIILLDSEGKILYQSPSLERVLGFGAEELLGTSFFETIHADDRTRAEHEFRDLVGSPGTTARMEVRCRQKGELWRTMEFVCTNLLAEASVQGVVVNGRDVTDRKDFEAQLLHDAFHDRLTELPNRALFNDRLKQVLARNARNPDWPFAVLFLDLDRFKVINDSLGHMVGDQLLVALARRIGSTLRASDTFARLGGDEFTILLENASGKKAFLVAERVRALLMEPFILGEHEVFTTASIGIATSEVAYERPQDVLRDADLAMYRAKEQGSSTAVMFDTSMHSEAVASLAVENDLRRALDREEFELHYQPIVRMADGTLSGFEALIRWNHPERGLLYPGDFLGIAEDAGLIVPLGRWVLMTVCGTVSRWRSTFPSEVQVPVHFNVSATQVARPDFVERVEDGLSRFDIPGSSLELELTESSMMANAERTVSTLKALKALDLGLSIDDFGTGYSSLSYLHRFPTDHVKIDRSFVRQINGSGRDVGLVRTIIDLAHDLGMEVVGEGVETKAQAAMLKELGCESAQGFLFAHPLPMEDAEDVLRAGRIPPTEP